MTRPDISKFLHSIATLGLAVLILGNVSVASAAPIVSPPSLNVGDTYRLAFITSTARDATSSDITDYNNFVTAAANSQTELAALGTTWSAIASTSAVDARDNTGTNPASSTGTPIFLLDGTTKIADDNADLWDSDIDAFLNITESGSVSSAFQVWSGTDFTVLQSNQLGTASPVSGFVSLSLGSFWISGILTDPNEQLPLYAISGLLTVGAQSVPEPGSLALIAAGLIGLRIMRRRTLCNT